MCYSFRTSVCLTCILKTNVVHGLTYESFTEYQCASHTYILEQNVIHGVTGGTVSGHQHVLHVYWSRVFTCIYMCYRFWTSVCLTCVLIKNVVHGVTWYNFRTSVYLTCILKQNIVHGVTCDRVSEHQYIWHIYWNIIYYMGWLVIQFQNYSISHMYIEARHSNILFSFCRHLQKWMLLSVVVIVLCYQYRQRIGLMNLNTRMGQNVSVNQRQDLIY